jgi:hypothetical protein
MYPKPARTYEEWRNATAAAASTSAATTKPQEREPGFEYLIAVLGILAAYCFARNER